MTIRRGGCTGRGRRAVGSLVTVLLLAAPWSAVAAHLTFQGAVFDGVSGADGLAHAQDLAVSPDGLHVYVASEEEHSVALYARDATTGALAFVQKWTDGVEGADGLANATSVAVSPDGAHVYVTGAVDDALAVFARDAGTGLLTFVEAEFDGVAGVNGLGSGYGVTLSPDGAHVYVAAYDDGAISVFSRDDTTGALTFVEAEVDGVGGVTGLVQATTPAVSPDGKHVYVASQGGDAVAVFARDPGTGALAFVEAQIDGVNEVDGLDGAYSVVVSADGDWVYVGSYVDHAVVTFSRNQTSGALTLVDAQVDGTGGIDGLNWPLALVLGTDGTKLYVAGSYTDHALAVFDRDPATGLLAFLEVHKNGVAGVTGLVACNSVRTSPDGKHVYTAARDPGSLAIFATPAGLPTTTTTAAPTTTTGAPASTTSTSSSTTTVAPPSTAATSTSTTATTSTAPATSSTTTAAPATSSTTTTTLPGCTSAPRGDCRESTKVGLRLRDRAPDAKDRLAFQWRRGAATTPADFGAPLDGTAYRLCVYREGALVLEARVPPGGTCGKRPCWRRTKKGFRYADRSRAADGISAIVLASGGEGAAAVAVRGAGAALPLPSPPPPLPLVAQVQASDASCWSGVVAGN